MSPSRKHLWVILAAAILAAASTGAAAETPRQELVRAIQLFENFQDAAAAAALHELLRRAPPAAIAARAHIYLALIQLNQADADGAKAELQRAVATDVMVDLPPGQSPKAQVLFAQARRELTTVGPEQRASPPPPAPVGAPAPPVSVPVVVTAAPVEEEPPSHLPAYLVGVGSLVAFGVGGLFGYLQQQALSNAENPAQAKSVAGLQNYANNQYPQDGLIADILFGVGAAAGVTAVILFATESASHGHGASVAVSAGPGGLTLQGAF